MKLRDVLFDATRSDKPVNDSARLFLSDEKGWARYAVGKNAETLALHRLKPLDGIVDDFSEIGTQWNGIQLIRAEAIPENALVANCSTSISPVAVDDRLRESNIKCRLGFYELVLASAGSLAWPEFVRSMRQELSTKFDYLQVIYNSLEDNQSKKTFVDVIRYRLTANFNYLKKYNVRFKEQYFEDFMELNNEVFVDAGGFDGDTSLTFISRCNNYKKVHFFEPSISNMTIARQRLSEHVRIEFHEHGLSNKSGKVSFEEDNGSASHITSIGNSVILIDTLDNTVKEPVSFIKIDIEGWEIEALKGARMHIKNDYPKLAVAVYHYSSDFRKIFDFIKGINSSYRVFLRHYTQGWSETIMYFVPRR